MSPIIELKEISNIDPHDLLNRAGITQAPVDIFALVESLPVKIRKGADDVHNCQALSGRIFVDNDQKPTLWVNQLDSLAQQRYTLAHQIGHLVTDIIPFLDGRPIRFEFLENKSTLALDARQPPQEYAANWFAEKLLVPNGFLIAEAKKIISDYRQLHGKDLKMPVNLLIDQLAELFGVYRSLIKHRLSIMDIY